MKGPMSAPPLTIQLFGTPRVLINDQPIAAFHSSKVAGLLYYLAADPRPRGRETLAGLLWPDYDATQGKKNLRGALYHLRKTLDPYLHVERQEIGLLAGAPVQVDLIDFEAALARARSEAEGSPAAAGGAGRCAARLPGRLPGRLHARRQRPVRRVGRHRAPSSA